MTEQRSAERPASRAYLLGEVLLVLAVGAVLLKGVSLGELIEGGPMERAYHPVRILVMLGFIAWLLSRTGQSWRDIGVRRPPSWLRAVGLGVAGLVAIFLFDQLVIQNVLRAAGVPKADVSGFSVLVGNVGEYLYFAGPLSWIVGGVGEEFIGRAYLISRLAMIIGGEGRWTWLAAIALSSILFGLGHAYQGVGGMIGTGLIGFGNGLIYLLARRNVWPTVIAHGLFDVIGFTAIFAGVADI